MEEVRFGYNQLRMQSPPVLPFSGRAWTEGAAADSTSTWAMASGGASMPLTADLESYYYASAGLASTADFSASPLLLSSNIMRGPSDYHHRHQAEESFEFPSRATSSSYKFTSNNNENILQQLPAAPVVDRNWSHHGQQQMVAAMARLPSDAHKFIKNWSALSNAKSSILQLQQQQYHHHHGSFHALNAVAGSLVLDSSRGELVNALQMTPKEILEAKAMAASKSHSEAERRRRERINSHLATLRSILPTSIKTDKASLLAEVIEQVKRLKRQVEEAYEYGSSRCTMPTENNEVTVEREESSTTHVQTSSRRRRRGKVRLRASLCCDDRPQLMGELKQALETLKLRAVRAEMATLGGRIKNVFTVASASSSSSPPTLNSDFGKLGDGEEDLDEGEEEEGTEGDVDAEVLMKRLEEELKAVMERSAGGAAAPPPTSSSKLSKRHKLTSSSPLLESSQ